MTRPGQGVHYYRSPKSTFRNFFRGADSLGFINCRCAKEMTHPRRRNQFFNELGELQRKKGKFTDSVVEDCSIVSEKSSATHMGELFPVMVELEADDNRPEAS
jgi:hypothetical protein